MRAHWLRAIVNKAIDHKNDGLKSCGYIGRLMKSQNILFCLIFFLVLSRFRLIFGKNAPCQLLRLNFKNKSDVFNYGFSFKLSAITRFCSRELDRERSDVIHLPTSLSFKCVNPAN